MQATVGPNPVQRYSTNFIEWDDTPSFAGSLSQSRRPLDGANPSTARSSALRRLLRNAGPVTLAEAMGLSLDAHAPAHAEPRNDAAHYGDTIPSALLPLLPSTPFREPLSGLAVREVMDADVFQHFFGR